MGGFYHPCGQRDKLGDDKTVLENLNSDALGSVPGCLDGHRDDEIPTRLFTVWDIENDPLVWIFREIQHKIGDWGFETK